MNSLEFYQLEVTKNKDETYGEYGGVCPKVMGTVKGEKVLIKGFSDNKNEPLAEYFAYKLGTKLGLYVNEVSLIDCGELLGLDTDLCSVHKWEDSFEKEMSLYGPDSMYRLAPEEIRKMKLFDEIINNEDRHDHNFGKLNNKLFLIDNGYAKPWQETIIKYDLQHKVSYSEVKEMVDIFLSLTREDFEEMLLEIPYNISEFLIDDIITRMLECQDIIKEYIEREGEKIA